MADEEIFNDNQPNEEEIRRDLENDLESDYQKTAEKRKQKNLKKLIKLDYLERERIAAHICDLYREVKAKHQEKCDNIDKWDGIYRMDKFTIPSDDGQTPQYRTPLTTTTLEVIHANIMNVFFTPSKIMRVIPTEEGDIPKINKLDIFGNWSVKNELSIFENCDRLFHSSDKNGTCPYIVYWVKEYGEEIIKETIPNPMNPSEPLLDEDGEAMIQEREVTKLLYDAPRLEVFSGKDYITPANSMSDKLKDWEMRIVRLNADTIKRRDEEGKYYADTFDEIGGWGAEFESVNIIGDNKTDKDNQPIPLGKTEKLFLEFYGRLRIKQIAKDDNDEELYEELEDEFIGLVEFNSETLCYLKKNRFPYKERPIGVDEFIPDDEGREDAIGVIEFMEGIQNCNDVLYNQYVFGVTQSNNPIIFFTPFGNTRNEPIKLKAGYMYPTADANSIKEVKFSPPDASLPNLMEQVRFYAQLLFGIGDYASGIESTIDPSAPAKKAELVVAQGNVRLNLIIRRKNKTLKDIFRRWFLLYKENMPKNKFMRIVGDSGKFDFQSIKMSDFALNSIPDFELTGNILNSNKVLDAQKKIGIYQLMIQNPFFNPQTAQGLKSLHSLTKWLLDGMDELGLSNFLPQIPEQMLTPQEENARFLQGDSVEPKPGEDHIYHLNIHNQMFEDPGLPLEIAQEVRNHIQKTTILLRDQITTQIVNQQSGGFPSGFAGANPQSPPNPSGQAGAPPGFSGSPEFAGMGMG